MTEYYSWNGVPVEVEIYDARDVSGGYDVTALIYPEHDTGRVPEGEVHYRVMLPHANGQGWWVSGEDLFWEYAEPLSPAAIERKKDRDGGLRSPGEVLDGVLYGDYVDEEIE